MHPLTLLATALCCLTPPITLGYAATCAARPFRACRRCSGTGHLPSRLGRYRHCQRCNGSGRRIRLAVHVWNEARRIYRNGTR